MANYSVDSRRQPMTATGIVEPVREWEVRPDGSRRPSDRQARDENSGLPLWGVEVLYPQTTFGRVSTVTAKVSVGSLDEPVVPPLSPVGFTSLSVEVRLLKSGGFSESWSAEPIVPAAVRAGSQDKAA
jgi:hypothetical protein